MAGLLSQRPHFMRVVVAALICCLVGFAYCATGFGAPAPVAPEMSAKEKQELVRGAVTAYERGQSPSAQTSLEKAQTVFPENYAVPYYLGLIYLEQGRRSDAIAQWQRYITLDPKSENALKIRKYLTKLLREEAQDFAKQAVAEQSTLIRGRADDKTVAVTSFSNLGSEKLAPLGKGMAAMLIADLSKVPDLKVVDRIKLQALLQEMKLGTTGLVDANTAPRVGKLLKARHVTSGSLADLDKENLHIASVVVDSNQRAGLISSQDARGELKEFYDLEKKIACQIIQALGKDCQSLPDGFFIIHTKSMPALIYYSKGLDAFDRENYDEARDQFQQSLDEDPKFDLALFALLATPTSAMMVMDDSQMVNAAASSGPSSATAGTAVATSATGSGATTASAGAGVLGMSPTTLTVAGLAAAGGVALAAGGGGGGGGGEPVPSQEPSGVPTTLDGTWRGTWFDNSSNGGSGEVLLNLTQDGSALTGTVTVPTDSCLPANSSVSGSYSGNNINLTIQSGSEYVTVNGTVNTTDMTMNGSWNYDNSASDCTGDAGTFSCTLTGGADINW